MIRASITSPAMVLVEIFFLYLYTRRKESRVQKDREKKSCGPPSLPARAVFPQSRVSCQDQIRRTNSIQPTDTDVVKKGLNLQPKRRSDGWMMDVVEDRWVRGRGGRGPKKRERERRERHCNALSIYTRHHPTLQCTHGTYAVW